MPSPVSAASAFTVALALVALPHALPLAPGTVEFFAAHALGWALANLIGGLQRKRAWEVAALPEGPPGRPDWKEAFPAWAFETAFLVHIVDVPMALAMTWRVLESREALLRSLTLTLDELPQHVRHGPALALEHIIFAAHFGVFLGDFYVLMKWPDAKMIAHHIGGMILLSSASLYGIVPGVSSLALCTALLELGSMGYSSWVLWRCRWTYFWGMHASNGLYFAVIVGIVICGNISAFTMSLIAIGVALIIGRTAVLVEELQLHKGKSV